MSTELSWGIKRVYGHSISSEYVNNCIDGFGATQTKLDSKQVLKDSSLTFNDLQGQHTLISL